MHTTVDLVACKLVVYKTGSAITFRSSASQVSLDRPTTSSQSPNHDRQAELRCRRTISVEQSSCCFTETRDDSAHFQETTEGLSVPDLMCWRTEGTFTTARRCCDVFVILAPDIKLQTKGPYTDQFSGTSSRCQSTCTSKLACVSCHWYQNFTGASHWY